MSTDVPPTWPLAAVHRTMPRITRLAGVAYKKADAGDAGWVTDALEVRRMLDGMSKTITAALDLDPVVKR